MLISLIEKYQVDIKKSDMVGDRDVDIIAGKRAGVKTVLINKKPIPRVQPDFICENLLLVVQSLTGPLEE